MNSATLPALHAPRARWGSLWGAWALCGVAAAGAGLALRAWTPVDDPALALCSLRRIVHIGCATCGLTRALAALAQGHLAASLRLHPMAAVLVIELAAAWGWWGHALARGPRDLDQRWIPWAIALNAAAFLLMWIVRLLTGTIPA